MLNFPDQSIFVKNETIIFGHAPIIPLTQLKKAHMKRANRSFKGYLSLVIQRNNQFENIVLYFSELKNEEYLNVYDRLKDYLEKSDSQVSPRVA